MALRLIWQVSLWREGDLAQRMDFFQGLWLDKIPVNFQFTNHKPPNFFLGLVGEIIVGLGWVALWTTRWVKEEPLCNTIICHRNFFRWALVRFKTYYHDSEFCLSKIWPAESSNKTRNIFRGSVNIFPIQFVVATCVGREGNSWLFLVVVFGKTCDVILALFFHLLYRSG